MSAVYSTPGSSGSITTFRQRPRRLDIEFARSDHFDFDEGAFSWEGVVWTPERPVDADELPMFHADEEVPEDVEEVSPTALVAPWDQKFWFSEIRSSYLTTVRYYNGWVPWYGTRPNERWYKASSLGAFADISAVYNSETESTEVYVAFPSHRTDDLSPGGKYRWDLRSASAFRVLEDGTVVNYSKIFTHIRGMVSVTAAWTLGVPIGEPS
jgi:hypothetical protein